MEKRKSHIQLPAKNTAWLPILVITLVTFVGCARVFTETDRPPLPTVTSVDLTRYAGTWYEIARLPMWFQRDCVASQAMYTLLLNGKVEVINQCLTTSGDQKQAHGVATVVDANTNAKLYVVFDNWAAKLFSGWGSAPTEGNYWILHLEANYRTALVGTPDREYLWILSRTPILEEAIYEKLVSLGTQNGFLTANLIRDSHPSSP
ncbi:MAG: lipocalin family protein [Nitrospirota bacterium]|nr:lipocalin family protein [Nitrospirota bacterium]